MLATNSPYPPISSVRFRRRPCPTDRPRREVVGPCRHGDTNVDHLVNCCGEPAPAGGWDGEQRIVTAAPLSKEDVVARNLDLDIRFEDPPRCPEGRSTAVAPASILTPGSL